MVCEEEEPRTLPLFWLCSLVFGLSGFLAFRSASCGIRQKKKEKEEMGEISCAWAFVELGFYYFFFLLFLLWFGSGFNLVGPIPPCSAFLYLFQVFFFRIIQYL